MFYLYPSEVSRAVKQVQTKEDAMTLAKGNMKFSSFEQYNAAVLHAEKKASFFARQVKEIAKDAQRAKRSGGISPETASIVAQTKEAFGNAQIEAKKANRAKEYLASIKDEVMQQVTNSNMIFDSGVKPSFRLIWNTCR